jgi:hypothetical protein
MDAAVLAATRSDSAVVAAPTGARPSQPVFVVRARFRT